MLIRNPRVLYQQTPTPMLVSRRATTARQSIELCHPLPRTNIESGCIAPAIEIDRRFLSSIINKHPLRCWLVDARRQPDNPLNSVILYLERTLNRVSAFTHFDPDALHQQSKSTGVSSLPSSTSTHFDAVRLVDARRQPDNPLNSVILYLERTLNRVSAFTHFDPAPVNDRFWNEWADWRLQLCSPSFPGVSSRRATTARRSALLNSVIIELEH
ncbi:hypothetical protein PGT21_034033 [Puccinia graminis f. sp. tritici]|uniref:Uncharacterized protein n=1 Tax=Puccinia graminis f. sp. tritici TaxID=56615 RepID=A0A5B0Q7L7_PUCGR|nr:hypothetical protein PGT21_034033 [Puccinia graminis f. sp. tritici]